MDATEIDTYLTELGHELSAVGVQQPVQLLMVGGAYMLTQLHARASTRDVDVILKVPDNAASPLYVMLQTAIQRVARRHGIAGNWLNDVVSDALRSSSLVPAGSLWHAYGLLEMFVPDPEYVLALKLLAGRPQDMPDIDAINRLLGITSRAQAQVILDQYIPDRQTQLLNHVPVTLDLVYP